MKKGLFKEQLKELYGNIPDQVLIDQAAEALSVSNNHEKEFVFMVYYIKTNQTYLNIPEYQNASFGEFLEMAYGKFGMTEKKFDLLVKVWCHFENEATELGSAIIGKSIKQCGVMGVPAVVRDIRQLSGKKKQVRLEDMMKIVKKHAKPKPEKVPTISAAEYQRRIDELTQEIVEKDKIIAEQADQISKLTSNNGFNREHIKLLQSEKAAVEEAERLRASEKAAVEKAKRLQASSVQREAHIQKLEEQLRVFYQNSYQAITDLNIGIAEQPCATA